MRGRRDVTQVEGAPLADKKSLAFEPQAGRCTVNVSLTFTSSDYDWDGATAETPAPPPTCQRYLGTMRSCRRVMRQVRW